MAERQRHRHVPEPKRAQEHLANERTFLAWVRTSIALLTFGLVLARVAPSMPPHPGGHPLTERTLPVGVALVSLSALLTLLAAWRYDAVNRQIESGMVTTDRALVWFVATVMAVLAIGVIAYVVAAG